MTHTEPYLGVPATLAGKRILLTGSTGFLAKLVLEKIVRSVPGVGRVLLLIRPGHHGDARARFEREVAASSVFEQLRAHDPAWLERFFAEKIECVDGDLCEADFGLDPARYAGLAGRVDLVINVAASVDFREPLDQALRINTYAPRHLAAFACAAEAPLVQVSTCYVNGFRCGDMREEVVRPSGGAIPRHTEGWYEVDGLIARLRYAIARVEASVRDPQERSRRLTALGIAAARRHGWNDTYTFTKWLGEQFAMADMRGRALTIVRPSIIESALREPAPGWIEGVKVADAVILAYARGRTRFFPARPEGIIDIIPADLAANAILLAGAEALQAEARHRIYQCCSGSANPLKMGELIRLLETESRRNWRRYERLFPAEPRHAFRVVGEGGFRLAMAGLGAGMTLWSGLRRLAGQSGATPAMERQRTTRLLALTFAFYAQPRCRFHNSELMALARRFGEHAQDEFPVDPRLIDWEDYLCRVHLTGLNRYALRRREVVAEAGAGTSAGSLPQPTAEAVR